MIERKKQSSNKLFELRTLRIPSMVNSRKKTSSSSTRKRRNRDASSSTELVTVEEETVQVSNEEVEQNIARGLLQHLEAAPPGYQFSPTDDELIDYLRKKKEKVPMNDCLIHSVNIYVNGEHPQKLTAKYVRYPNVDAWYFFTPRQRKYANGKRPNRTAGKDGFWRATEALKDINFGNGIIGHKQALVFYEGDHENNVKTRWNMHEYRIGPSRDKTSATDMRLDDWVLCRVSLSKKKARNSSSSPEVNNNGIEEAASSLVGVDNNRIEEADNSMALVAVDDPFPINHTYNIGEFTGEDRENNMAARSDIMGASSTVDITGHNYRMGVFDDNHHPSTGTQNHTGGATADHYLDGYYSNNGAELHGQYLPELPQKMPELHQKMDTALSFDEYHSQQYQQVVLHQPSLPFQYNMEYRDQDQYLPYIPPQPDTNPEQYSALIAPQQTDTNQFGKQTDTNQFGNGYLQNQENHFLTSNDMVENGPLDFSWELADFDDDLTRYFNDTGYIPPSCSKDPKGSNPPNQGNC